MEIRIIREGDLTPEQKLKFAFAQAIGIPGDIDFSTVQYGVTENWDSVAHMQLVAEIENVFDVMFTSDQVIGMNSFEKAKEIVGSHGVVFPARKQNRIRHRVNARHRLGHCTLACSFRGNHCFEWCNQSSPA